MEAKQHASEQPKITEEIKNKIKICIRTRENQNISSKPMGCIKSKAKRRFIAIQVYLKKKEKHQINNLRTFKVTRKKENPKVSRRK